MIDVAALTNAVFASLEGDIAGNAVRALLGDGAASVLTADRLSEHEFARDLLPAVPLIAMRREPITRRDRIEVGTVYTLYCYDDPAIGYGRLEALIQPIAGAFASGIADGANLVEVEVQAGRQDRDSKLGLLLQIVEVVISAV